MDVERTSRVVDPSGRGALLLGIVGDVCLVDCRGASPDTVGERVAAAAGEVPVGARVTDPTVIPAALAAGAALVHVPAAMGSAAEVRAAAGAGALVVLAGDELASAPAARDLLDHGGRPGRVVVECATTPDSGPPDADRLRGVAGDGVSVGAVLRAGSGPVDEVVGWQVGMLAQLLELGVRTVRNVSEVRFRRVQAVLDAIREAERRSDGAAPSRSGTADAPGARPVSP